MTSMTAILSRWVSPPLLHRPWPGARRKLVAPPNFPVSSLSRSVKPFLPDGLAVAGLLGEQDLDKI